MPEALQSVKTTTGQGGQALRPGHAFRGDDFGLRPSGRAGTIDFAGAVFKELVQSQVSPRISDHLPLWVEFATDRSEEAMARTLGVSIDLPDPFVGVVD
ncbi:hypothetical protein H1235_11720 [Pseudoxanthomonas sp. NC8]|nr:hypothetical protein H1235_11720 [Pseudoxanthomonas sp. NC8]